MDMPWAIAEHMHPSLVSAARHWAQTYAPASTVVQDTARVWANSASQCQSTVHAQGVTDE